MGAKIYTLNEADQAARFVAAHQLRTPFSDVMPRLSDDAYEKLKSDIEQNGLNKAILVDEDSNILDGHHRYRACTELGIPPRTEAYGGLRNNADKRTRIIALNLLTRELSPKDRKRLSDEQKRRALEMLAADISISEVSKLVGRPRTTIIGWRDADDCRVDRFSQHTKNKPERAASETNNETKVEQMTPAEQKAKALDLYSKKVRKSDIATALGVDWGVVSRWIADPESEASTRGYGSTQAKAADDAEIVALFDEGKGVIEIARTLGVAKSTISRALKRRGLGRAGEKSVNPLIDHIRRADAETTAWGHSADTIVALASISPRSDVEELARLLGDLSRKVRDLKTRLNKEVGKDR